MKVCYRKSDGLYCDSSASYLGGSYPGDEAMVHGPNVIGRFGGKSEDYVVISTRERGPWLKRYVGAQLVDDEEKLAAIAARQREEQVAAEGMEALRNKIRDKTATPDDVLEYLAEDVTDAG